MTIVSGRIDAARRIGELAAQMRQRKGAASFLETLGLKDASLVMSDDGQQTVLQIPESRAIDAPHVAQQHRRRRGNDRGGRRSRSSTASAPKTSERHDRMKMTVDVEELVPRSMAQARPGFELLEGIDLPVAGHGTLELSRQGDVIRGTFDVTLGAGRAHLPWLGKVPLELSGGEIKATYAGDTQRLVIELLDAALAIEPRDREGADRARDRP